MLSIELRLSDVDPPAPDPPRTIYRDVVNLPDPVQLGITIRYFNHDDVGLYFRITGSGTGYTFGTVDLGLLASGANAYINLDQLASRAKPASGAFTLGEFEEIITLILRAYTDAGYTILKWTYERSVTVHWIKSDDPAFTVDVLNNFNDGTVQGWALIGEAGNSGGYPLLEVVTDYVLSAPYSIRVHAQHNTSGGEQRSRLYKSFTTPNKSAVFAIIDVRCEGIIATVRRSWLKYLDILYNTTVLLHLGKVYDTTTGTDYFPRGKWMRIVVPLPINATFELRIIYDTHLPSYVMMHELWLDDFKIISK